MRTHIGKTMIGGQKKLYYNVPRRNDHSLKYRSFCDFQTVVVAHCALDFVEGDAEKLPFDDNSFDAYTIAFGLRNVTDIEKVCSYGIARALPCASFHLLLILSLLTVCFGEIFFDLAVEQASPSLFSIKKHPTPVRFFSIGIAL